MKTAILLLLTLPLHAELKTLTVTGSADQSGYSETITLAAGDSARLSCAAKNFTGQIIALITIGQKETSSTLDNSAPLVLAGPCSFRLALDSELPNVSFATFDIVRAGVASGPVVIPQEAGSVWQLILESSSDLVNWSPSAPGDFQSTTPQRYFRTRLVRK